MGRTTTTQHDELGRVAWTQAPGRYKVYTEYDERGRIKRIRKGVGIQGVDVSD
jgi:hypothetical protein